MATKTLNRIARELADMEDGDIIIAIRIGPSHPVDANIIQKARVATTFMSENSDGSDPRQEKPVVRRIADASEQAALDARDPDNVDAEHLVVSTFADGDAATLRGLAVKLINDAWTERGFAE